MRTLFQDADSTRERTFITGARTEAWRVWDGILRCKNNDTGSCEVALYDEFTGIEIDRVSLGASEGKSGALVDLPQAYTATIENITGNVLLNVVMDGDTAGADRPSNRRAPTGIPIDYAGAVLGVVGSGGQYPTSWDIIGPGSGWTHEITTVEANAIEVRLSGTPTGTNRLRVFPIGTVAVAQGETWRGEVRLRTTAGDLTNVDSFTIGILERQNGTAGGSSATNITSEIDNTDQLFFHERTITGATTTSIQVQLNFSGVGAGPVDFTLRIESGQALEIT